MDLGVAERRLRLVIVDEAVVQTTRVAARKGFRHYRFGELRVLQRLAVHRAAARLVGEKEGSSELRCNRTGIDHPVDVVGAHQSPCGDDGDLDPPDNGGEQFVERLLIRLCHRIEGAAMAARRRALHGDRVDAAADRGVGFIDRRHGCDRGDTRVA